MTNLFLTNRRRKLAVSTVIVSVIAIAAIVVVLATASATAVASGGPSATGAVYIIDNSASGNNVWVYPRSSNGQLGSGTAFSTGGTGTGSALASQGAVVLTQNGQWLLVVDAGSNQITVFSVQGTSLVQASITSSQGSDPISLAVSGNLVYVLDAGGSGNIAGFTLGHSGALTFISGSVQPLSGMPTPSPEQIGFNPQGNVLIVAEKGTNIIDTYTVGPSGVASAPWSQMSAGSGPYGFAFTYQGKLIVSEAASNSVSSYAVSNNGQLITISGAMPTFGNAPCWLVVNGNSQYAVAANAHGGTISIFSMSSESTLTLTSSVAAHTAIPALDMAFSHGSQFLYIHNGAAITGFQVLPDGSILSINSVSGLASSASGLAAS
jgi:6-phosphogluconolactonase